MAGKYLYIDLIQLIYYYVFTIQAMSYRIPEEHFYVD